MRNVLYLGATPSVLAVRLRIAGARRYLKSSQWDVRLVEIPQTTAHLRETLAKWNPLGCIVERGASVGKSPTRLVEGIPAVFCDPAESDGSHAFWSVRHDAAATTAMAFDELRRLNPRHYAFVRDPRNLAWSREREQAFVMLVRQTGTAVDVLDIDARLSDALSALPKPCGIFAANDDTARATINAAVLAGIDLPDDLQIVGVNNDTFQCENAEPTLTSVQPDFEYSGYLAMETLHRIVTNRRLKPKMLPFGPLTTVRRASTRLLPQRDARVTKALDVIAANYADPRLTTSSIARQANCSRRLLDLRFREITGRSVREELRAARLAAAKRLALDPTRNLSQIPSLCGCSSNGSFLAFFKTETGLTLSEFRRRKKSSRR